MSNKRRILLVDDELGASYLMAMILKLNDFDVAPYSNPELALSDFNKDLYDLVLMDVEMPEMNGFDLYKKMREIDDNVRVCFMTNDRPAHLNEFKRLFPDLTQNSFVQKPVTTEDLLKILRLNLVDTK